ncbi:MAG: DeoR/GlpR family DNA-binding transcription regulator [Deltaproteobacteria bacterium]|nr:DeoR/GlpR family DNA-binding transcription regulator [Deltaproteobacteria bacterium]
MKVPLHIVQARRERLAQMLREHSYLPLGQVCARLGISEATARRDLVALEQTQAITRTRGGAISEYNRRFPSFRDRLETGTSSKQRIASAAHKRICANQVVWFDGGTTCYALAQALAAQPVAGLTVVTNNLPAAELLADHEEIAVHLLGGQYFRRSSILAGGHALDAVKAWRFDVAFLGAEGLTHEGLWNSVGDVVALQRAVAGAAAETIFCLDADKVGKQAPEFLLPLSEVHQLLTDATAATLAAAGVKLKRKALVAA